MCGIAGLIQPFSGEIETSFDRPDVVRRSVGDLPIDAMVNKLRHRGPDDRGVWDTLVRGSQLFLGHTRLSILDLSDAARQPMIDPDSGCILVYNGEVYNFADLRSELAGFGKVTFTSTGDTEVILRAYLQWGSSFAQRLRGMFAFAIYDPRVRRLLLGRDHLGIKPLYMTAAPGGYLAFASEVRALLELTWVRRELDPVGLMGYLAYGSVQDPHTLVGGIQSVPAGHTVTVDLSGGELRVGKPEAFWEPQNIERNGSVLSPKEAAARVRQTLAESVRRHMVSDVPLGVFLSGGMDSSSIVALMAEAAPSRVHTLTVSFEEAAFNESGVARAVARRYETQHTEVRLTPNDFLRDLPHWLESLDQPSADGANTWVISRACKKAGITVALSGLGGDELFAGYPTFKRTARAERLFKSISWLPARTRSNLATGVRRAGRESIGAQKLAQWIESDGSNLSAYLIQRTMFLPSMCDELLEPSMTNSINNSSLHDAVQSKLKRLSATPDTVAAVSLLEVSTYLLNTLLRDCDQASMAHSVEIRTPFVDHDVAAVAFALPGKTRAAGRGSKPLLRSAMHDKLDSSWVDRPKMGFTFPFDQWFRGEMRNEIEQGLEELSGFPFRPGAVRNMWNKFLLGDKQVNSGRIMTLFVLAFWLKRHEIKAAA